MSENKTLGLDESVTVLTRIFPGVDIMVDGHFIDEDENDFAPPHDMSWYHFINTLHEHNISLTYTKPV